MVVKLLLASIAAVAGLVAGLEVVPRNLETIEELRLRGVMPRAWWLAWAIGEGVLIFVVTLLAALEILLLPLE